MNKIADKIEKGFEFKGVSYSPKDGMLDILVPKSQLKQFTKEGGKYYNQYQKLLNHASDKGVKVNIGSKL